MGLVDITNVTGTFIAVSMLFILGIFSLLSFALVSFFQQKIRRGWLSILWSVIVGMVFYMVIANVLVYEFK
ncbi:hypothetical protein [Paenibacillus turpanensis]|uniref:hypothetical protein n=1 Tax=Paenibacillus turpanensis TaxID=2689078 RepID=UPI001408BC3E|nr:hypothetical protein [Paenibacillus turpanensis]